MRVCLEDDATSRVRTDGCRETTEATGAATGHSGRRLVEAVRREGVVRSLVVAGINSRAAVKAGWPVLFGLAWPRSID